MANNFRFNGTLPSADNVPRGCKFISCDNILYVEGDSTDQFSKNVLSAVNSHSELNDRLIDMNWFVTCVSKFIAECGNGKHDDVEIINFGSCCVAPRKSPVSTTYMFTFRREVTMGARLLKTVFGMPWSTYTFSFTCYRVKTEQELEMIDPTFEPVDNDRCAAAMHLPKSIPSMGRCSICSNTKYPFSENGTLSKWMEEHLTKCHSHIA